MRQTWILIIISILFVIGQYKHILLIEIHGSNALVWKEKPFFPPLSLELKFIRQMGTWILTIISIHFVIGHYKHILLIGVHDIDPLDWQENFFPPFFLQPKFI